ncbi:hypothetical protein G8D19_22560 [Xanthomonas vesicatoria]|nr:hypothetical protein [Xanthomonas vesicatoria]
MGSSVLHANAQVRVATFYFIDQTMRLRPACVYFHIVFKSTGRAFAVMRNIRIQRGWVHGYCGEFRVETLEVHQAQQNRWVSTAYIYHRNRDASVATIEGAGEGAQREEARAQALRVACEFCGHLNADEWRKAATIRDGTGPSAEN